MELLEKNFSIFNFSLSEINEALYGDDEVYLFLLEAAADDKRIFGPYKKLMGTIVKYYFKTAKNNIYTVNFISLGKKRYVINFHYIKNASEISKENQKKGESSLKGKIKKGIGKKSVKAGSIFKETEFNQLEKEEGIEVLSYVFKSVFQFVKKFTPDSLWFEPSITEGELEERKERLKKINKKDKIEGKGKFDKTKRGRIYKLMVQKGLKSNNAYDFTYDNDFMVIFNKSKHKDKDKVLKSTPNFRLVVSYFLHKINLFTDKLPKEIYEDVSFGELLLNIKKDKTF